MTKILTAAYPTNEFLEWIEHNSDDYNILTQYPGETVVQITVFDYTVDSCQDQMTHSIIPSAITIESPDTYNRRVLGIGGGVK